ncbi:MAG: class D sortase [Gammaproteobacteria bacterium]
MSRRRTAKGLNIAAKSCLAIGLTCSAVFVAAQVDQKVSSAAAIEAFHEAQRESLLSTPDQTLWSDKRKSDYEESLHAGLDGSAKGILEIPSIELSVPIFDGTSEIVLNRGLGWIEGTAELGGSGGNIGLAGHRDGFFRGLKDIEIGNTIELQTMTGIESYVITDTFIVEPTDVFVLDPTPSPSLTLVTCYPFYFVGHAPQRFIVRAELMDAAADIPTT